MTALRRRSSPYRWAPLLGAIALATPRPVLGSSEPQATEVASPPLLTSPSVTLAEAVRHTALYDAQVQSARQQVVFQQGRLRETRGLFDHQVQLSPSLDYAKGEVIAGSLRNEERRRLTLRKLAEVFDQLAQGLAENIAARKKDPPRCPVGVTVSIDGVLICLPITVPPAADTTDDLMNTLDLLGRLNLRDRINNLRSYTTQFLTNAQKLSESLAAGFRRDHDNLGAFPFVEVEKALTVDLRYRMPFRNGIVLSPGVVLDGLDDNYAGKTFDPKLGGKGVPTTFSSIVGLTIDVPLGQGRGATAVAAPERGAAATLRASVAQLRHTLSERQLATVLAYWDVAAAQQNVTFLEKSAANQERILEVSEQLVRAREIPRAEMSRIRARVAEARSTVAAGQQALITSRLNLARSMGLAVEDVENAPLASEAFAPAPALDPLVQTPAKLLQEAMLRRQDLRALYELRDTSRIFSDAARSDLKRPLNLSVTVGYNGLYETLKYRFYHPVGFARSFWGQEQDRKRGLTGPSVIANLTFGLPFRNSAARGRLMQAESSFGRSDVLLTDLGRRIRENVLELSASLKRSAEEVEKRRQAVVYYEETLEAAMARYRAGDLSLIDTLQSEELLTRAKLDLVEAARSYATLLAQVRFETGLLVKFTGPGDASEAGELSPFGLAAPEKK